MISFKYTFVKQRRRRFISFILNADYFNFSCYYFNLCFEIKFLFEQWIVIWAKVNVSTQQQQSVPNSLKDTTEISIQFLFVR